MKLTFDTETVRKIIEHATAAEKHRKTFGETEAGPAVWLVGDQGVYLMSNGRPGATAPVAYATGINPDIDEFDGWWERKRAAYGGDDGCDALPITTFDVVLANDPGKFIALEVTPGSISVYEPEVTP